MVDEKYVVHENKVLLALERVGEALTSCVALIFTDFNLRPWSSCSYPAARRPAPCLLKPPARVSSKSSGRPHADALARVFHETVGEHRLGNPSIRWRRNDDHGLDLVIG